MGRALALHTINPGLIPGTLQGTLSLSGEIFLCSEPKVIPSIVRYGPKTKKKSEKKKTVLIKA